MLLKTKSMTVEEFDEFVLQPQNIDCLYEYIAGEIVEVVSNAYSSKLAVRISTFLGMYLLNNDIGHLTGANGGYMVAGERYIPDVAFISYQKQPVELSYTNEYIPEAPDLAVEVLSPGNREDLMTVKTVNFLNAGTTVWLVHPPEKCVYVMKPAQAVKKVEQDMILQDEELFPNFVLPIDQIFPQDDSE